MGIFKISLWVAVVAVLLSLASCDPISSVEYSIINKTSDTVSVTFYKEIMTSPYQGYDIEENDSVTIHYQNDSSKVATLAPDQRLSVHREWNGLYREELIVPIWKYIKSINTGDLELPAESWNKETAWYLKTEGGKRFQGESRYYSLLLWTK
ncbi:MAG: hypothetical protein IKZ92_03200 [Muribaculaceae bacterium]|nr:hypothetical protein [Muribaculaceae bacterium]